MNNETIKYLLSAGSTLETFIPVLGKTIYNYLNQTQNSKSFLSYNALNSSSYIQTCDVCVEIIYHTYFPIIHNIQSLERMKNPFKVLYKHLSNFIIEEPKIVGKIIPHNSYTIPVPKSIHKLHKEIEKAAFRQIYKHFFKKCLHILTNDEIVDLIIEKKKLFNEKKNETIAEQYCHETYEYIPSENTVKLRDLLELSNNNTPTDLDSSILFNQENINSNFINQYNASGDVKSTEYAVYKVDKNALQLDRILRASKWIRNLNHKLNDQRLFEIPKLHAKKSGDSRTKTLRKLRKPRFIVKKSNDTQSSSIKTQNKNDNFKTNSTLNKVNVKNGTRFTIVKTDKLSNTDGTSVNVKIVKSKSIKQNKTKITCKVRQLDSLSREMLELANVLNQNGYKYTQNILGKSSNCSELLENIEASTKTPEQKQLLEIIRRRLKLTKNHITKVETPVNINKVHTPTIETCLSSLKTSNPSLKKLSTGRDITWSQLTNSSKYSSANKQKLSISSIDDSFKSALSVNNELDDIHDLTNAIHLLARNKVAMFK